MSIYSSKILMYRIGDALLRHRLFVLLKTAQIIKIVCFISLSVAYQIIV